MMASQFVGSGNTAAKIVFGSAIGYDANDSSNGNYDFALLGNMAIMTFDSRTNGVIDFNGGVEVGTGFPPLPRTFNFSVSKEQIFPTGFSIDFSIQLPHCTIVVNAVYFSVPVSDLPK
jgi:hypothetical protein